jgi:hypothetical protein
MGSASFADPRAPPHQYGHSCRSKSLESTGKLDIGSNTDPRLDPEPQPQEPGFQWHSAAETEVATATKPPPRMSPYSTIFRINTRTFRTSSAQTPPAGLRILASFECRKINVTRAGILLC